jgi:hypothetical protein
MSGVKYLNPSGFFGCHAPSTGDNGRMARKRTRSHPANKPRNPLAHAPLLRKGGLHRDSKAKRRREDKNAVGEALDEGQGHQDEG